MGKISCVYKVMPEDAETDLEQIKEDIKELIEEEIIAEIPDHQHVREGIALREPVVSYKPKSRPSNRIEDLAYRIKGEEPPERGFSDKFAQKVNDIGLF